jgi:lauroyl/myristoyl acyltransferase
MIEITKADEEKEFERGVILILFIIFTALLPLSLVNIICSVQHHGMFMPVFKSFIALANLAGCFGTLYYYITSKREIKNRGEQNVGMD